MKKKRENGKRGKKLNVQTLDARQYKRSSVGTKDGSPVNHQVSPRQRIATLLFRFSRASWGRGGGKGLLVLVYDSTFATPPGTRLPSTRIPFSCTCKPAEDTHLAYARPVLFSRTTASNRPKDPECGLASQTSFSNVPLSTTPADAS